VRQNLNGYLQERVILLMNKSAVDVLIIGAGPAGLSAALNLYKSGVKNIRIVERESEPGGIPRHSQHLGYGVRDLHRLMSGPNYAKYYSHQVSEFGIPLDCSTSAVEWAGDLTLALTSPNGLEEVSAKKIILATGARERSRSARLIPGSRPHGLFTTGSLQQSVYLNNQEIGTRAVVIGAEHVSFSAIMTLSHAGVKPLALITSEANHQSFGLIRVGARVVYKTKLLTKTSVVQIIGDKRVAGVRLRKNGQEFTIDCDTVVFSANWIPDNELARRGNISMDSATKSPIIDENYQTSRAGVYALGNILLPIKAADQCALESRNFKFN
jgi:thioredoxin reductase